MTKSRLFFIGVVCVIVAVLPHVLEKVGIDPTPITGERRMVDNYHMLEARYEAIIAEPFDIRDVCEAYGRYRLIADVLDEYFRTKTAPSKGGSSRSFVEKAGKDEEMARVAAVKAGYGYMTEGRSLECLVEPSEPAFVERLAGMMGLFTEEEGLSIYGSDGFKPSVVQGAYRRALATELAGDEKFLRMMPEDALPKTIFRGKVERAVTKWQLGHDELEIPQDLVEELGLDKIEHRPAEKPGTGNSRTTRRVVRLSQLLPRIIPLFLLFLLQGE